MEQQKLIEAGAASSVGLFGVTLTEIDLYISIAAGSASLVVAIATAYLLIRKIRSTKNGGTKPKDS